ncbi:MAG: aminotransferase class III-fold pyridoxal phosphate-dependent enzyme [Candidatus Eisenbacteria bacterium]
MVTDDVVRRLAARCHQAGECRCLSCHRHNFEMASFVETFFRVAVPEYFRYAFFIEGGALAVENAIKAAVDWKVQKNFQKGVSKERYSDGLGKQVIHCESFHGRSGYTVSLTDSADPNKTRYFAKFEWPRIVNPKVTFPLEGRHLEEVIAKEKEDWSDRGKRCGGTPTTSPASSSSRIQGEGGDNHFRTEFFQELRRLADSHEFLLIFDEADRPGLTGRMWAHQHHGSESDPMSFGKKTQVCGILAGPRLIEIESNVFHVPSRINSTRGGNLLDMVRCQLYLEIYEEENLVQQAATTGEHLLGRLHEMAAEFEGIIENVRGQGLFCAFDLTDRIDRKTLIRTAYEEGLVILPSGRKGLRFRPPLSIEIPVLEEGLNRLQTALRRVLG